MTTCNNDKGPAKIAVVGAGWWTQGWHLPHLNRNESSKIVAIVDRNPHPSSNLNPKLEPLADLSTKYDAPTFDSVEELLKDPNVGPTVDGVLVATPHATHYAIGTILLEHATKRHFAGEKPLHIFMEKPMTTDVEEAKLLYDLVDEYKSRGGKGVFLVNHSANYRRQTEAARSIIESGKIGSIRHISASFASALTWIFDDVANKGWNEPSGSMQGNGFAWGQSCHLLGFIYHVCPSLVPEKVFCVMNHSATTGADVSHSATIICRDGDESNVVLSISGTTLLPGNAHSHPPVGKQVQINIYGSEGAVIYCGIDNDVDSGRLELRGSGGETSYPCGATFDFENIEDSGFGPESLKNFIAACRGEDEFYSGASCLLGLRTVQTVEAFYRSNASSMMEDVRYKEIDKPS